MSTSRTKPFPTWNPNRLDEIAQASGQTVEQLRAQIAERARLAAQPGHLQFDVLERGEFSEEEQRHLDSCMFCQDLHEGMNETLTTESVQAWLDSAVSSASSRGVHHAGGGTADPKPMHMAWPVGWRIAASVAAVLVVGAMVFLVSRSRATPSSLMAAMTTETRFSMARDLAAAGEYPEANDVLLAAFERSEIKAPVVHSVRSVLRTTPAKDPATRESTREQIDRLIKDLAAANERQGKSTLEARQALELSGLQMKSGATRAGYETLGTYLKLVNGSSPTTAAYEARFVHALPPASDAEIAPQSAGAPGS